MSMMGMEAVVMKRKAHGEKVSGVGVGSQMKADGSSALRSGLMTRPDLPDGTGRSAFEPVVVAAGPPARAQSMSAIKKTRSRIAAGRNKRNPASTRRRNDNALDSERGDRWTGTSTDDNWFRLDSASAPLRTLSVRLVCCPARKFLFEYFTPSHTFSKSSSTCPVRAYRASFNP